MPETRIIKRYANRKLYDTQHSQYVTLEQISEMIRDGDDVRIIDNKTKEDLTSVTLAQIIFEEEKKQKSFLPLQAMRNIIQTGGDSIHQLVSQAQRRVSVILPIKDGPHEEAIPHSDEEGMLVAEAEDAKAASLGIREFRDFVRSSQQTIEEWQKRIDDRIRHVVEGIAPFKGLQNDVRSLADRIAELEEKLARVVEEGEAPARPDTAESQRTHPAAPLK